MSSVGTFTLIPVITIKNISKQLIPINIKPFLNSPIYKKSGTQNIAPGVSISVEDNRVDLRQINKLADLKLISYERTQKRVEVTPSGGSSGA